MSAIRLTARHLEKVWGRTDLPAAFRGDEPGARIGEVVFQHPDGADLPLLIKYLFTSERLSVQVHPDDAAAARAGLARGKDEAWIVIGAEPDGEIATGVLRAVDREALRAAALDGSIVDLLDWQRVASGDALYSPAGTIHAIGAGVSAVEVQQNADVTYRLYDYGRDRELHLEAGLAAVHAEPADLRQGPVKMEPGRTLVIDGPKLRIERFDGPGEFGFAAGANAPLWFIPQGEGTIGDHAIRAGEVWLVDAPEQVTLPDGSSLLVAAEGEIGAAYSGTE